MTRLATVATIALAGAANAFTGKAHALAFLPSCTTMNCSVHNILYQLIAYFLYSIITTPRLQIIQQCHNTLPLHQGHHHSSCRTITTTMGNSKSAVYRWTKTENPTSGPLNPRWKLSQKVVRRRRVERLLLLPDLVCLRLLPRVS